MRILTLVFCLLLVSLSAISQRNGKVSAVVYDSIARSPIPGATVTVVAKKDSSLISFGMTDNQGRFQLTGIPDGEFRLLLTHVNYHNRNIYFTISENSRTAELGSVRMDDRTQVLEEVVVSNEAPPVTMIGDTVQYNAGSFKVQPNASVEQLLRRLPGVKVEKDGTVKAQGEKVTKVLVDGKEFFGNDPKMATKNLPADAVDKVQVYEKQSDQAELTGFEDGNYEKTINLKLKEDKKKGAFGKISAGGGNEGRYEGKFNVNSFKGARQLSAIGMANNTNAEGFSFMDILNFSGALSKMQKGGGNISFNLSSDESASFGLGSNNTGINTAMGAGINYNNIIGKKVELQSSYFYNRFSPDIERQVNRQNFLPGTINYYDQNSFSNNTNNNQRLNLNILYQIDSMHSLRFTPSLSYQSSSSEIRSDYRTLSELLIPVNDGMSNTYGENKGYNFSNNLIFRKKFQKKGRTFSASLQTTLNEMDGLGQLNSITNFYDEMGTISSRDTLNQQYTSAGAVKGYNARLVYTEPLFKRSLMEFSLGKSNNESTSEKITYDFNNLTGRFDQINQLQTNDFINTYGYTTAGFRLRTQKRKYNYSLGVSWQRAELEGEVVSGIKDSVINKSFTNFLTNASFKYNISKFRSFSLTYNTYTTQPTVSQLQPVADLSNRLHIREGNPDLKQEYTHSLQGNLNLVSPYKNKNLFLFFTFASTSNKIVNSDSVDVLTGVRYTRPVNVSGVYNLNSNISYSIPARFVKGTFEISARTGAYRGKQFINSVENEINTLALGPELRLDMNPHDKLNLMLSANYSYTKTKYSLESALNTNYLAQDYSLSLDWQLPARFYFSTEFNYTINSQRAEGFNAHVPILNASISKQFLKFNRGEIKFSVADIFNRNIGISRNTNQNYIEDVRVNSLRRFCLLSITYSLSRTGLNNNRGEMRIIRR